MMLKWIIVVIVFVGDVPVDRRVLWLDPDKVTTQSECRGWADKLVNVGKENDAEVWAECIEVKRDVKPQKAPLGVPGTERKA